MASIKTMAYRCQKAFFLLHLVIAVCVSAVVRNSVLACCAEWVKSRERKEKSKSHVRLEVV